MRRHFWRYASMSEVSELYISRMLRMAALFMMASFMSIYLYQLGYSLMQLGFYWTVFFLFKSVIALPVARLIAWVGPKHGILISNLLYIPAMIAFALLPQWGPWLIPVTLFFQAVSATMYSISYLIDFSKVKNIEHAGKEIAYMNIFEKITTGLSPVVGGFIAFIWGPQVVLIVAGILFAFAAAPLFNSGEQVRVNQKLQFRGFPYRLFFNHAAAQFAIGFDSFTSGTVWALFLAITILSIGDAGNSVYASMGVLLSVVFVVAIFASYTYGKLIDKKKGHELMKASTVISVITHLVRPFTSAPVAAAGVNAAHELGTTGYLLPYTRAVFDNADRSGMRTTYLGLNEVFSNFGAAIAAAIFAVLAVYLPEELAMKSFFFIGAAAVLLIFTARFPLYKK